MTGAEHYREAERLAEKAFEKFPVEAGLHIAGAPVYGHQQRVEYLAAAQVHATLAVAAATIDAPLRAHGAHGADWDQAVGGDRRG